MVFIDKSFIPLEPLEMRCFVGYYRVIRVCLAPKEKLYGVFT